MYVIKNGAGTMHYAITDYLGSILKMTNEDGSVIVAEQSFDAWGRYRNPANLNPLNYTPNLPSWLYRGFTGHEHLPPVWVN